VPAGVDLEQDLVLLDQGPGREARSLEEARDARPDLDALDGGDPAGELDLVGELALFDGRDPDRGRGRGAGAGRTGGLAGPAGAEGEERNREQEDEG